MFPTGKELVQKHLRQGGNEQESIMPLSLPPNAPSGLKHCTIELAYHDVLVVMINRPEKLVGTWTVS